jgi:hypothetical protein
MKKAFLLFAFATGLLANLAFGQDQQQYAELIKEAWQLYENKAYLESGQKYAAAFVALGHRGNVNDRYNAACSWALAGERDSAFVQLFKIAQNGNYTNLRHLTTDSDLDALHDDERWAEVVAIVSANKEQAEAHLDKALVAILDTVFQDDQGYRRQVREIEEKHGWESDEMKALWDIIRVKDSINLLKVSKILEERGWLGADVIGGQGNHTLFLVIQHAELDAQLKYLPMMREAAQQGKANARNLALLEDRVALRQGKRQIYGSQVGRDQETGEYYVLPLEDPEQVDQRRAEVGLPPLQEYIANWGLTWDAEEYKRQLPEIEAKQKQ